MKVACMNISLPKTWQWSKCSEIVDVRDGTHDTPKYVQSGYPLVTSKNLKPEGIDFETVSYISEEDHTEIDKRSKVDRGDILFAMIGTIGNPVLVDIDTEFSIKNIALFKFSDSPVDPKYFKFLLETPIIKRQLDFGTRGGTQKFVSLKVLRGLMIPFPSIAEQRRIVAILDKADAVRRDRKQAIQYTEELLRSAFLDMFGDPVTNPKGWDVASLSEVVKGDIRNGLSPSSSGTHKGNVLTLSAITQGRFDIEAKRSAVFDRKPPDDKMTRKSLFLVCRGNGNIELVGCGRFPDKNYEGIMFPDTMIAIPLDSRLVERHFFEYIWNSVSVRHQIEKQARTTNGTHKVNQTVLKNIQVLLPPIEIQKEFASVSRKLQSVTEKFLSDEIEQLFNSLLQRAFKGEL